jgi:pyruvate kinase
VRSVEVLDAIIRDAETIPMLVERRRGDGVSGHAVALCEAAVSLSARSGAHAIVAVTREGNTAKRLSAIRPQADIVAATNDAEVARRLSIFHGVLPVVCDLDGDVEQVITRVVEAAVLRSRAPESAIMVVVNASADLDRGASNFVRIRRA